ncbi:MAG TPA: hypothetical protein PKY77_25300 [Phycisphaerae bacterium]|nr:hypothetical protein [Phycisphaerae bacterium]HOW73934.1 hypothetical protein [Phycisphaerae bacterium]HSA29935.1 hypothetical protein [Phycisphaerae bacterium]
MAYPREMADAWLGHSSKGTSRFDTGDAQPDYLLPLVKVIGQKYFSTPEAK